MIQKRLQFIAFLVLLVAALLLTALMFLPYLKLIFLAIILAILFQPVYKWLEKKIKNQPVAAFLTLLVILLIVIAPLYFLGQMVFNELAELYDQYRGSQIEISQTQIVASLPEQLRPAAASFLQDLGSRISSLAASTFTGVTNILSNIAAFFLSFFLVFFSLYYFLRDGAKIKDYMNTVFPLAESHENYLVAKLAAAISGVVKGRFLVALIQAGIATVGYFIFGMPNPVLWGAFTAITTLVPNVGTALAIVPAVAYLFIIGSTGAAIGLAIWGALLVGTIDNIVGPKLIGGEANLHPLLVLFSILGGVELFGLLGILLGPILMSVFVALLDVYKEDLKAYMGK